MMVIAAFPSLGNTAISELNKFRVIDIEALPRRIIAYRKAGYTVKLTNSDQKYIEDVVKLPSGIVVPNKNKSSL